MDFLAKLTDQINTQLNIGENSNKNLNSDGVSYGSLGDFAKKFDRSARRSYVEEGYLRQDPYNTAPKQLEILMQNPNATVFIKKKMFSSLAENFRPDYMDSDEKLYYKAIKILFQNKCKTIAALEKLSKIQKITEASGEIDKQLMPLIFSLTDAISSGSEDNLFGEKSQAAKDASEFSKVIGQLRKVYAFSSSTNTTNWITDDSKLLQSAFGNGTGVIEITNFTRLNTTVTTSINNSNNFSLSITDPYEAMLITEYDIERAMSDATNSIYDKSLFQTGLSALNKIIDDKKSKINLLRSNRNVGPISFKINPDTLLGKRVSAILDRTGTEILFQYSGLGITNPVKNEVNFAPGAVAVDPNFLKGGAIAGIEGLSKDVQTFGDLNSNIDTRTGSHKGSDSEFSLFKEVVSNIFSKIQLQANSQASIQASNKDLNYTRRKLRFNFLGKLIIQPMDTVHIYAKSNSNFDDQITGGLQSMFNGAGVIGKVNNSLVNFQNSFDTLFNPSGNATFQVEKAAYVGRDFPNRLWSMVRSQFINENEGTHIFAGIVSTASSAYGDGKFTVTVNGSDNSKYFEMGKVNFKPGVDVFNGSIHDPLTPFKSKFDQITANTKTDELELLEENKAILGSPQKAESGSAIVRFKNGPNSGQRATTDNYIQDRTYDKGTGNIKNVFYAPDGLVYKWKEGIGITTQFGSSFDQADASKIGDVNIFEDPFAGQDVMNVISLLVIGKPYNYVTYCKAAQEGFGRDPQSGQDANHTFINSLQNGLTKANASWGNFIPFKNLVLDEKSYNDTVSAQITIVDKNKSLTDNLNKLKDLDQKFVQNSEAVKYGTLDQLGRSSGVFIENGDVSTQSLKTLYNSLTKSIQSDLSEIKKAQSKSYANVQVGDNVSFDFDNFIDSDKISKVANDPSVRRLIRRQINYLTRRQSYDVRANEDTNLFIVDDYYDKDYDITAFENKLSSNTVQLYNNEFSNVKEKITHASQLLNLEVFCDTQGHLRVRPQQYNRMPSSVFYKMMYLKKDLGIQVFPQFLEDLFSNQLTTLKSRIEIIEDQIRLDCAALGLNKDSSALDFILFGSKSTSGTVSFSFISSEDSGYISNLDEIIKQSNPESLESSKDIISLINGQSSSTKEIFSPRLRYKIIDTLINDKFTIMDINTTENYLTSNSYVDKLIQRIQTKSGQKYNKRDYLINTTEASSNKGSDTNVLATASKVDVFKVTQELSDKIAERQKVLKLFSNTIKNVKEYKSLDDSSTGNSLLLPGSGGGNSHVPEVFEHMIEDETYDDYGKGSGKRFIIKNSQIKSSNFYENPPNLTSITVKGILSQFNNNNPPNLEVPNLGNGLVTATAVDYDTWRIYGATNSNTIEVPFLNDPVSQCGPYASMLLSIMRKEILQGQVTISGNEFMQPGEVVFLEGRGMLYYITSVSHDFSYGSSFNTTLELKYGHAPGEYIPTPLDIIGKLIYNNKDVGAYEIHRQTSSNNETSMGVIERGLKYGDRTEANRVANSDPGFNQGSSSDPRFAANIKILNNILYQAAYAINSNNSAGNDLIAKLQLRIYFDKDNPLDSDIESFANVIKDYFTKGTVGPGSFDKTKNNVKPIDAKNIEIVKVDMSDDKETISPSQKALDAARNQANLIKNLPNDRGLLSVVPPSEGEANSGNRNLRDKIRQALYKNIVDCWVSFDVNSQQANNQTAMDTAIKDAQAQADQQAANQAANQAAQSAANDSAQDSIDAAQIKTAKANFVPNKNTQ